MTSSPELLTIGDVSRRTGKPSSAIRYYEAIGVIPKPTRINGRRRYTPEIVRTLAVIDTAQRAGLDLDEIRLLLEASAEDASSTHRLREVAERKLPELVALIERTVVVVRWLEAAARCECPTLDDCPLFDGSTTLPERRRPEPTRR